MQLNTKNTIRNKLKKKLQPPKSESKKKKSEWTTYELEAFQLDFVTLQIEVPLKVEYQPLINSKIVK